MTKKTTSPVKNAPPVKRTKKKGPKTQIPPKTENIEDPIPPAQKLAKPEVMPTPQFPFYKHSSEERGEKTLLMYESKVKVLRPRGDKFTDLYLLTVTSSYEVDAQEYEDKAPELLNKALPIHLKQCLRHAVLTKLPEDIGMDDEIEGLEYTGTVPNGQLVDIY